MSDTPSYTELKQMHAEATRMRDEAFEYRAEAERKLVEANYLFGQTAKGVAGGGGSSGRGTPLRPSGKIASDAQLVGAACRRADASQLPVRRPAECRVR
jgi:hypothetical protein